jgi:lipopolysaccharide/colanic/teichoic acid biosynthesis glycosyltransferase
VIALPSTTNTRPLDTVVRNNKPRPRKDGVPVRPSVLPTRTRYLACKTLFDIAAAAVLCLLVGPVIAAAAALVKLTSRGPAFYSQTRLGKDGQPFTIWKLRTMIHNCESLTGPRWAIPGDPRVTWIGRVLRTLHLDELPQLLNVLRGEMSLIGPRPERPEFVPELERAFPVYRERLNVRPGVSGLAQLQLPPDTDLESVRRKLMYDLYYIQNISPSLDLRILLGTLFYALGIKFHAYHRILGIPAGFRVESTTERLVGIPTPVVVHKKSA